MSETAKITIGNENYDFPIVIGSEQEKAIDILKLRQVSSLVTFDPGFGNTGACKSAITFLDGEQGILRYRGVPIEQIAEKSIFIETAYLLIYGELPTKNQLSQWSQAFTKHANVHKNIKNLFTEYPADAHPMATLSSMVCALSAYYPELIKPEPTPEEFDTIVIELLSKIRTLVAYTYKKLKNESPVDPRDDLRYVPNFLHMMFSTPEKPYEIKEPVVNAMQTLLVLHADHEQNCSTSTVRMVGSSWANLFASISAGICALWGPLHGGANQEVVEMLKKIYEDGGNVQKYIDKAKDPNKNFRLMGFGHRVYKNYDPRAKIIKQRADALLNFLGIDDPLLEIALKLEEAVLKDDYFISRKLYPNVDFYSGIIYKAIGIPTEMFPVMFAVGRLPGWIAHWKEMKEDPLTRIGRPRQIYIGPKKRDYIPIDQRG